MGNHTRKVTGLIKRGGNMEENRQPSFAKGMIISYLFMFASVVVFIPLIGPILGFTLIPYLSGALGARFAHPKERVPLAITTSMTWSILEVAILLIVLGTITRFSPMGLVIKGPEIMILVSIFILNLVFMLLGVFHPWKDPFADIESN